MKLLYVICNHIEVKSINNKIYKSFFKFIIIKQK